MNADPRVRRAAKHFEKQRHKISGTRVGKFYSAGVGDASTPRPPGTPAAKREMRKLRRGSLVAARSHSTCLSRRYERWCASMRELPRRQDEDGRHVPSPLLREQFEPLDVAFQQVHPGDFLKEQAATSGAAYQGVDNGCESRREEVSAIRVALRMGVARVRRS